MELWCPHAVKLPFRKADGGTPLKAPSRGILHTTETWTYTPSQDYFYGGVNPPHMTVNLQGTAYQHYPINRAARALRHLRGTIDTNRMGHCFQIEIVGYAAQIHNMPAAQAATLRKVMRWAEAQLGIRRAAPLPFHGSEAWGTDTPWRMEGNAWIQFNAWGGHQHVSGKAGNSHWDPGLINMEVLLQVDSWTQPGDPIRNRTDAVAAARYQGGQDQARLVGQIPDESTAIMVGRTLDLLMQHDLRLRALE